MAPSELLDVSEEGLATERAALCESASLDGRLVRTLCRMPRGCVMVLHDASLSWVLCPRLLGAYELKNYPSPFASLMNPTSLRMDVPRSSMPRSAGSSTTFLATFTLSTSCFDGL